MIDHIGLIIVVYYLVTFIYTKVLLNLRYNHYIIRG